MAIAGPPTDTALLAYYLDKQIAREMHAYRSLINFNITLIPTSPPSPHKPPAIMEKEMMAFCGDEPEWKQLLEDTNLKYNIKQYGMYFGELPDTSQLQSQIKVYSTEDSLVSSVLRYGMSNYATHAFFRDFASKVRSPSNPEYYPYPL